VILDKIRKSYAATALRNKGGARNGSVGRVALMLALAPALAVALAVAFKSSDRSLDARSLAQRNETQGRAPASRASSPSRASTEQKWRSCSS
jgi:hypothetical protein